jgi:CBS domain containing-hemolysin-like protein
MSLTIAFQLLGGVFLLAANAFFVAIEFALTRLRQYDKEELGDDPGLQRAWKMTEELEIHLTGCQVGITTTSILLGVIAEPGVTKLIQLIIPTGIGSFSSHSISIVLSLIIINFVHTVWGLPTSA